MGRQLCIGAITLAWWVAASAHAQVQPPSTSSRSPADTATATSTGSPADTSPASSKPPASSAGLDAGKLAYEQGRFGDALDAFELSYRKTRDPQTLLRIADAADKLAIHARAVEAYEAYLGHFPNHPDHAFISSRIAANRAALEAATAPVAVASRSGLASSTVATTRQPVGRTSAGRHNPAGPWWAWVAGGAVVVAGIVVAGVLVSTGSAPSVVQPIQGNVGGTVQTLSGR